MTMVDTCSRSRIVKKALAVAVIVAFSHDVISHETKI